MQTGSLKRGFLPVPMTVKHAGSMETYSTIVPKSACSRTVISCISERPGATNGSRLPLIPGNLHQTPRGSPDLSGGQLSGRYLLDKRGMPRMVASSSFKPRAPRHINCDWAPLGYLFRRQEGGGWRVKNSVSTDLLVYRRAAQAEFRQKKQLRLSDVHAHRVSTTGAAKSF